MLLLMPDIGVALPGIATNSPGGKLQEWQRTNRMVSCGEAGGVGGGGQ